MTEYEIGITETISWSYRVKADSEERAHQYAILNADNWRQVHSTAEVDFVKQVTA